MTEAYLVTGVVLRSVGTPAHWRRYGRTTWPPTSFEHWPTGSRRWTGQRWTTSCWLREPGRRGQRQRCGDGGPARRPAGRGSRQHHQPALRIGLDAVGMAARAVGAGDADLIIAGGWKA